MRESRAPTRSLVQRTRVSAVAPHGSARISISSATSSSGSPSRIAHFIRTSTDGCRRCVELTPLTASSTVCATSNSPSPSKSTARWMLRVSTSIRLPCRRAVIRPEGPCRGHASARVGGRGRRRALYSAGPNLPGDGRRSIRSRSSSPVRGRPIRIRVHRGTDRADGFRETPATRRLPRATSEHCALRV